ncbi:MAG TPA: hypothetical protein PKU80_11745 [Candidatus Limiplasma sp.]|nr:hypothetical protein [Candidatus Limiplasma sp.]HRX09529.1 hypothetical protein [Candidatus Limiplasma sp.]
MKDRRFISDTTLLQFDRRMPHQERLGWMRALDDVGVYEIVWKPASQKELDACTGAMHSAKCAVYVHMDPAGLQKALRMGAKNIHLEVPASYPMIYTAYHKNKDWAKKTYQQCKDLLMHSGKSVTLVLTDASRAEPCFLETLAQMAAEMPIEKLILKDLMGLQSLSACAELTTTALTFGYPVGYESSDQFGLSVANTIQALRVGAAYASCCLGGLGHGCDLRRLLQTTNRIFDYGVDRKGAEQLDRTFKQTYRDERLLQRQNSRFDDCRLR